MKLISLFSGIGAFEKALTNLNIDHEVINYCEFDKYASESYSAIHGIDKSLNLGDITKIDITKLEKGCADLITYGFPCQDISNAGKQKGFKDENGNLTRSGLFFYASAIIGRIQPKIAICENVKALASKKFAKEFKIVLAALAEMGYNNYWQVLNAKDYGIPQNRERVFVVSVRKDIDNGQFEFPKPFILEKRLADMLESEVDEKYYLSDRMLNYIISEDDKYKVIAEEIKCEEIQISTTVKVRKYEVDTEKLKSVLKEHKRLLDWSISSIAEYLKRPKTEVEHWFRTDNCFSIPSADIWFELKDLLDIETDEFDKSITEFIEKPNVFESSNRAYSVNGLSPTITATTSPNITEPIIYDDYNGRIKADQSVINTLTANCGNDAKQRNGVKIIVPNATKQGYQVAERGDSINLSFPNSKTRRGRVGKGVAQTLDCQCNQGTLSNGLRIRKLTPRECWRLMGFDDKDIEKAQAVGISNAQLYKQAGNSIVVNVLVEIFKQLQICELI